MNTNLKIDLQTRSPGQQRTVLESQQVVAWLVSQGPNTVRLRRDFLCHTVRQFPRS